MPIYEYICDSCKEEFAVLKLSSTEEQAICPGCGSTEVTKRLSIFSCSTPSSSSAPAGGT